MQVYGAQRNFEPFPRDIAPSGSNMHSSEGICDFSRVPSVTDFPSLRGKKPGIVAGAHALHGGDRRFASTGMETSTPGDGPIARANLLVDLAMRLPR